MKTKAYTDLEQSKKLAEILPIESSDMCYEFDWDLDMNTKYKSTPIIIEESNHFELYSQDIPCWSLSALLSILKDEIILENGHIMFFHHNKYNNGDEIRYTNSWTGEVIKTEIYSHLVDTCFEMIIKLHEKKTHLTMIYILRTLWVIGAIPVCLTCAILLIIGLFTYPIAESINYIIHGSTDTMEWEVWTMAFYIEKKYNKIKEQIGKQK